MNPHDPKTFSLDINDPEDAELIEYFLGELPDKINAINVAFSNADYERLCRLAHQLKGAAAGFGFPSIGEAAAELDEQLRGRNEEIADSLDEVRAQVEGLVALCRSYITPRRD